MSCDNHFEFFACLNSLLPVLVPVRASPLPSVVRVSWLVKFFVSCEGACLCVRLALGALGVHSLASHPGPGS